MSAFKTEAPTRCHRPHPREKPLPRGSLAMSAPVDEAGREHAVEILHHECFPNLSPGNEKLRLGAELFCVARRLRFVFDRGY